MRRTLVIVLIAALALDAEVKVAIVQYSIQTPDSVGVDADRMEAFVREAASNGADLVVAPETAFYRYSPWEQNGVTMLELANEFENLTTRFSLLCKELGVMLVMGLREPSGDPIQAVYNTALFIDTHGEILGRHRKMNPSNDEKKWTKAGEPSMGDATPFATPLGQVGMLICKDMDNSLGCKSCPDWDVRIAQHKMDLFIGVNGDSSRGWTKVVRGSQIAKCYGVGANLAQGSYEEDLRGNSGFVTPQGEVIQEAGVGEKIIYQILPLTKKEMPHKEK